MIELHSWPTPNGLKISIFLEEAGLEHKVFPVNIGKEQQFAPFFLSFSPNNRIPAIRDLAPADGGEPVTVFESGAILIYLADKTGKFLPKETRPRNTVMQWLMWQMGGFGPMLGQNHHFVQYAPEKIDYAINRYVNETARLYGVLDRQLEGCEFVAGDYSIADMAIYPWANGHERQKQNLDDFPNVKRWFAAMQARPAVERAYATRDALYPKDGGDPTPEQRAKLYGIKA